MIREGFVLRKMPGMNLVMPTGANVKAFGGALILNDTGALIYSALAEGKTVEEAAAKLAEEYDVSEAKAKEDVIKTLHSLKEAGVWAD